jgi:hypothetical protein
MIGVAMIPSLHSFYQLRYWQYQEWAARPAIVAAHQAGDELLNLSGIGGHHGQTALEFQAKLYGSLEWTSGPVS